MNCDYCHTEVTELTSDYQSHAQLPTTKVCLCGNSEDDSMPAIHASVRHMYNIERGKRLFNLMKDQARYNKYIHVDKQPHYLKLLEDSLKFLSVYVNNYSSLPHYYRCWHNHTFDVDADSYDSFEYYEKNCVPELLKIYDIEQELCHKFLTLGESNRVNTPVIKTDISALGFELPEGIVYRPPMFSGVLAKNPQIVYAPHYKCVEINGTAINLELFEAFKEYCLRGETHFLGYPILVLAMDEELGIKRDMPMEEVYGPTNVFDPRLTVI